ncbi:DUF1054 domain-containing protein [Bacillus sp. HMF5848]|uniref:DUF1054 domain-containing protein n=1 Tax=Bacillus sp. HMF5848 TaxID=2495421 RepID=UPI000F79CC93|nr:DUF1054 domain-containing protein [Bacillus sp. HMF5848]RSK26880.1 DUF1054 domain-containing protein [Bacillus sp. HMF5848]
MSFSGFSKEDFDTFNIEGLDTRMTAIQERIQPKFKAIGSELVDDMAMITGQEMYVHIAKHARRTVNPPKDTWMAFCHDKRGYKKHPHFQIGVFDDHVFIWHALIYELPRKQEIATNYLNESSKLFAQLPTNYKISVDHTKKEALSIGDLTENNWEQLLVRLRDVKKAELLIGKHFQHNDPILHDGQAFLANVRETFQSLLPFYRKAF